MCSRIVKYFQLTIKKKQYSFFRSFRWLLPSKKNGLFSLLENIFGIVIMAEIEINTKIFRKDNLDIVYSITGKKLLNGILHYKLKSDNSEEIFLSEHAVIDRFVTEAKHCSQPKNSVSRLFTKIIKNGYIIGKSNEK